MAAQRVPGWYWYLPEEGEKRQPRWFEPRGPLRGGPARSAKEPQTPSTKTSQHKSNEGKGREGGEKTRRPTIVTVEKSGKERIWGPLSRTAAWRAGCFLEDMQEGVKVFIQKDGKMHEVEVEKRFEGGREKFWFNEKKDLPEQPAKEGQEPAPEEEQVVPSEEDTKEEIEERNKMWLMEKVTTLGRENEEMKNALQELTTRISLQDSGMKEMEERRGAIEATLARVCESVQRLNAFTEGECNPVDQWTGARGPETPR